jgi:hypothetical protein
MGGDGKLTSRVSLHIVASWRENVHWSVLRDNQEYYSC